MPNKIFIFAGGHKIPELSFNVKISKRRWRKIRQIAMGKKPRLPRKLKKALRKYLTNLSNIINKKED